jgi:hypothetical protein
MRFSAILGQFLPRAPRCATLRCVFSFQIFYILYFIMLARILDILDQSRLGFCPVQECCCLLWYPQCSPPGPVPKFQQSFLFYMDVRQPLDPMATMATCAALWPLPLLFKLHGSPSWFSSSHHAHHAAQPTAPSWPSLRCSLLVAAPLFCFYFCFFFKAPVVLKPRLLGLQSPPLFSPVWA